MGPCLNLIGVLRVNSGLVDRPGSNEGRINIRCLLETESFGGGRGPCQDIELSRCGGGVQERTGQERQGQELHYV